MSAIALENVRCEFGRVVAVNDVNLTVAPGEFLTLLGPSGCGKTTTLRMVAGLEHNSGGVIRIGDEVVSDPARSWFVPPERRRLGMVFQSYAIWPHLTVFENVAYPLRIRRMAKHDIERRVVDALKLVDMAGYETRPAPDLSGGQQQRVAIARSLVCEPSVLLLDEPLSNLDAKLRTEMGDEFRAIQERLGITALYVTHDQNEAMALSDRVVVMQRGDVLQVGSPEEIYLRPRSAAVAAFLGAPNLLPATVMTCERTSVDEFALSVEGRNWSGAAIGNELFSRGDAVLIMVRPENARIVAADDVLAPAQLSWTGQVSRFTFRGSHRTITVGTDAGDLQIEAPALTKVRLGEKLRVAAPSAGAWVIRP
jgi:iron(III) transport system ATP-binding protein